MNILKKPIFYDTQDQDNNNFVLTDKRKPVTKREFEKLSSILFHLTGINLPYNSKNISLLSSRLSKVMRKEGISSFKKYLKTLQENNPYTVSKFVSAMTTNTTHFFREAQHFDLLKNFIPEIILRKKSSGDNILRVWCSAASTGQEPYTIAMTILEALAPDAEVNLKMLATDIDTKVLNQAAQGVYTKEQVKNIPPQCKQKYFTRSGRLQDTLFRVNNHLYKHIQFAQLNLKAPSYPFQKRFDIIFCRNVLIYFKQEDSTQVIQKMADHLEHGGLMFLGHAESGISRVKTLHSVGHAVYKKL